MDKATRSRKALFLHFRDRGSTGRGVRFFDWGDFLRFLLFVVPKYGTGMVVILQRITDLRLCEKWDCVKSLDM